ncbi:MAG: DUF1059 domain-containing protein [Dehalococcoidia bacterium]
MALTLSCLDLGSPCETFVSGETVEEIIVAMSKHAMAAHGRSEEFVKSEEVQTAMRTAVKQSSRPAHLRTSKLDF